MYEIHKSAYKLNIKVSIPVYYAFKHWVLSQAFIQYKSIIIQKRLALKNSSSLSEYLAHPLHSLAVIDFQLNFIHYNWWQHLVLVCLVVLLGYDRQDNNS